MEHFEHLVRVCSNYGIPATNLVMVDDVAAAAVELGWELPGEDTDANRLAKIRHDISPPIILIRRSIDWNIAEGIARSIPVTAEEKTRRLERGLDKKWFLTHLVLHEIAHFVLAHHKKSMRDYSVSSEAELKIIKEREADWWAVLELEKMGETESPSSHRSQLRSAPLT